MSRKATLIGDGIENPANALVMKHAAAMFSSHCRFRDTKGLVASKGDATSANETFSPIEPAEIAGLHPRVVAFDNAPGASELYGYEAGPEFSLLVGNERRGLSHECLKLATDKVEVPMMSRRINCLNVAAASAVALYYLCNARVGRMTVRNEPARRRPELLLMGAANQFELGSSIRSAAAFGWNRVLIEDRNQVWFGCDRAMRSEGRAAARRGKNDILCVPCDASVTHAFARVAVVTTRRTNVPLHRANLTRGASQLVVIPDESAVDAAKGDWERFEGEVEFTHLEIPATDFPYHYRLIATIALAEIARQVGQPAAMRSAREKRPPFYDARIGRLAETNGELLSLHDLMQY